VASFSCECAAGYEGATCATNIDECSSNPCMNGGACTDGVASFSCACVDGFSGPSCAEVSPPPPPTEDPLVGTVESYGVAVTVGNIVHTTYRLRLPLQDYMASVYAMYGSSTNLPHVPAAYISAYAAADGGVAPPNAMFAAMLGPELGQTSFLALGPDTTAPNTGVVGDAIAGWAAPLGQGGPLTLGVNPGPTNDFSFFWMDPTGSMEGDYTAIGGPLIAQLTLPSDQPFFVKLGLQGKPVDPDADDWSEPLVIWMHAIDGECPAGMTGEGCMTDVDECADAGCSDGWPNGADGCWNGIDEYACLCADGSTGC